MAVKARTWTDVDHDVSDILTRCKEESGLSYRDIEARTGINYVRVRDICLAQHGTPTLGEYLAICEGFRLDPVDTLRPCVCGMWANCGQKKKAPPTPWEGRTGRTAIARAIYRPWRTGL